MVDGVRVVDSTRWSGRTQHVACVLPRNDQPRSGAAERWRHPRPSEHQLVPVADHAVHRREDPSPLSRCGPGTDLAAGWSRRAAIGRARRAGRPTDVQAWVPAVGRKQTVPATRRCLSPGTRPVFLRRDALVAFGASESNGRSTVQALEVGWALVASAPSCDSPSSPPGSGHPPRRHGQRRTPDRLVMVDRHCPVEDVAARTPSRAWSSSHRLRRRVRPGRSPGGRRHPRGPRIDLVAMVLAGDDPGPSSVRSVRPGGSSTPTRAAAGVPRLARGPRRPRLRRQGHRLHRPRRYRDRRRRTDPGPGGRPRSCPTTTGDLHERIKAVETPPLHRHDPIPPDGVHP